jgi:hypothetical protein
MISWVGNDELLVVNVVHPPACHRLSPPPVVPTHNALPPAGEVVSSRHMIALEPSPELSVLNVVQMPSR